MNNEEPDEVRAAIRDQDKDDIALALAICEHDEAPASDVEILAAIGAIVGLIGADWARSAREEFIALAAGEMLQMPGILVLDALARARRRVTAGRQLVAWVADDVEPKADRLRVERERLTRLAELADIAS